MMNKLRTYLAVALLSGAMLFSCDSVNNSNKGSEGSGSESQTTPNDSSGAASRQASGVGEDNQDDSLGYPPNQSNLNSDSTSAKHDN